MKTSKLSFTNKLIIANVICFIPSILFKELVSNSWFYTFQHFQIWRLLTAVFSHANIAHLIGNMSALFLVGNVTEIMMKDKKEYLLKYLICGIGANILSVSLDHSIATVGASGAISGVIGMQLALLGAGKKTWMIGILILLISSLSAPNIDVVGHLAGFTIGVLLGMKSKAKNQ